MTEAKRRLYHSDAVDTVEREKTYGVIPDLVSDDSDKANLVGSDVDDLWHMPVVDIDGIPVSVVPSTTPGNCHLYIDKKVTWGQYKNLLVALYECGIIEPGYLSASMAHEKTFVRKPGHPKPFKLVKSESPRY